MNQHQPNSTRCTTASAHVMASEEFDQVVAAIATGRYSWACVLILRIAGYNPLHYLPYRTYRRLIKENSRFGAANRDAKDTRRGESRVHSDLLLTWQSEHPSNRIEQP